MKLARLSIVSAITIALAIPYLLPSASAEKQPETGVVKDGVYKDSRYGFSVKIPPEWRDAKAKKEPTVERLQIVQKKPRVPLRLQDNAESALKPTILIFADSTTMTPEDFFAFLNRDTVRSPLKDKIQEKSVFLEQGVSKTIEVQDKIKATVAGQNALRIKARIGYTVRVLPPGMSTPYQVNDYRSGYIYLIPFKGWMMYIEEACENQFLESLQADFDLVTQSLTLDSTAVK